MAGADINGIGYDLDFPPLVLAADHGLVKMVKLLVKRGADLHVAVERDVPCRWVDGRATGRQVVAGTTALHQSVKRGRMNVVRLLLRSGGDPNVGDSRGATALHVACDDNSAGAILMATALLDAGADPWSGDTCGALPIHLTAKHSHTDLFDLLLLKAPATLNQPSSEGHTPLCIAAMHGREGMVMHLLRQGAKQPVFPDAEIPPPLVVCVEENHGEVLRILLDDGGGSMEVIRAALNSAICNGRAKILQALIGRFGELFARLSQVGVSVLHLAVMYDHLPTVSVLLATGANETAADIDGDLAIDMIGAQHDTNPATEAAMFRMLERGPAFRATSWKWRASMNYPVGAAGGASATLPGGRHVRQLRVRIFRPTGKKTFVKLVGRWARRKPSVKVTLNTT